MGRSFGGLSTYPESVASAGDRPLFQVRRDHVRTFAAIPMLTDGRPLVEIADAPGCETAWSFTAMFKRVTGKAPSKYSIPLQANSRCGNRQLRILWPFIPSPAVDTPIIAPVGNGNPQIGNSPSVAVDQGRESGRRQSRRSHRRIGNRGHMRKRTDLFNHMR